MEQVHGGTTAAFLTGVLDVVVDEERIVQEFECDR
jgi:hypothetical protein